MSYRTCVIDHVKGMKVKVPVWDALAGLASSPPPPPSPPLRGAGMGGRGGIAGRVLPGNSERGRGVTLASLFSRLKLCLILAEENRVFIPRNKMASQFGISFWRFHSADFIRGSIWQIYSAGKFGKFIQRVLEKEIKAKKRKVKVCIFCRPVMSHHRHCI